MRLTIALLAAMLIGCSSVESTKYVVYEQGSINLHPLPVKSITEGTLAGGENEIIMPDGSYVTVSGTPSLSNLYLITNQNDGTSQTSRGQVQAEVSPTVTGQGNATGGADSSTDTINAAPDETTTETPAPEDTE